MTMDERNTKHEESSDTSGKLKSKVADITPEISTKEAYFANLKVWVHNATICQNATALFPWYLLHTYPQLFQQPLIGTTTTATHQANTARSRVANASTPTETINSGPNSGFVRNGLRLRILSDQAQSEFIARNGGYEYVLAPFWKRIAAEIIDTIILLTIKIVLIFCMMHLFDVKFVLHIDRYGYQRPTSNDDNFHLLLYSLDLFAFSSDLMLLEFATKFVVCIYEAIWTVKHGATPGKALMGLSIRYVEAVHTLPQNDNNANVAPSPANPLIPISLISLQRFHQSIRVLLFPGEVPNFQRALMRALCKSIITTILFPMFFLMVFMKNNRTVYDIMTKTIVVEKPLEVPILRRNSQ